MENLMETRRLYIRKLSEGDARELYENHLDDEVRKWFPNECYADEEEALDAARFFAECVEKGQLPFVLAVELKETGELIGDTGISEVEGKPEETEVGYCRDTPPRCWKPFPATRLPGSASGQYTDASFMGTTRPCGCSKRAAISLKKRNSARRTIPAAWGCWYTGKIIDSLPGSGYASAPAAHRAGIPQYSQIISAMAECPASLGWIPSAQKREG